MHAHGYPDSRNTNIILLGALCLELKAHFAPTGPNGTDRFIIKAKVPIRSPVEHLHHVLFAAEMLKVGCALFGINVLTSLGLLEIIVGNIKLRCG